MTILRIIIPPISLGCLQVNWPSWGSSGQVIDRHRWISYEGRRQYYVMSCIACPVSTQGSRLNSDSILLMTRQAVVSSWPQQSPDAAIFYGRLNLEKVQLWSFFSSVSVDIGGCIHDWLKEGIHSQRPSSRLILIYLQTSISNSNKSLWSTFRQWGKEVSLWGT